jgi:hypothetical protein
MAFEEISVGQLQSAQQLASQLLVTEANFGRHLYLTESLVMLAASHVLLTHDHFYRPRIEELTNLGSRSISNIVQRFEAVDVFQLDGEGETGAHPHFLYRSTELGARIMDIFQRPIAV